MLPVPNLAFFALFGVLVTGGPVTDPVPSTATVSGRLRVIDRGGRPAQDVGQAVIWLMPANGRPPAVNAGVATITTENRTFSPHVVMVPVGSTVRFPNRDGFNHNVFSLTDGNAFDLGLYERGEGKSATFANPGVVSIFCNVHSNMSAIVVVRNSPWAAQPLADGSFTIGNVPPGEYVLHLWHERVPQTTRPVTVTAAGLQLPELELDARAFVQQQHLNKFGRPYARSGRRY
jgi:plastocyanin